MPLYRASKVCRRQGSSWQERAFWETFLKTWIERKAIDRCRSGYNSSLAGQALPEEAKITWSTFWITFGAVLDCQSHVVLAKQLLKS
jgi:hypothetical protein